MKLMQIRIKPGTNKYTVAEAQNVEPITDQEIAISRMLTHREVSVPAELVAAVEAELNRRQIERMVG